ncbi:hypothetical protein [Streptomyces kanamyceticus]|uniref:Uncharacterized protein n=1 Tax=Streptomyces kanamyceticus TaxID=1967 RepID=A0A5J6GRB9_STRKN|nr:hypothetical protein [Streptomyces kanamyceticus]QEU96914.1 hypothetical protein CP970_43595 [Streptomyces kanamyceticus]
MIDDVGEQLEWQLYGWDSEERLAHLTKLTRDEILRVRDLFPGREDEWLATAAYEVTLELYEAMLEAIPRLEFRAGLDYQVDGHLRSS